MSYSRRLLFHFIAAGFVNLPSKPAALWVAPLKVSGITKVEMTENATHNKDRKLVRIPIQTVVAMGRTMTINSFHPKNKKNMGS